MLSEMLLKNMQNASWIRAMFEEGEKLRKLYGSENIYDFTLGNPDPEPPLRVKEVLKQLVNSDINGLHKYMNNAGHMDVRIKIANKVSKDSEKHIIPENIIMTCGAAGGLNVILKSILNLGEEVIIFTPYFAEYIFYIDNHSGKCVKVPTDKKTFQPIAEELEKAITRTTKAIIINSPNNPTGVIYTNETLLKLARVIEEKEKEFGTTIYVISDEPYVNLVYDNVKVPHIFNYFKNGLVVYSYSKSLSLAGERVGFVALNDTVEDSDLFMKAMIFANRTLGYVNAPSLFQKVIAESLDVSVDVEIYKERRDIIYNRLIEMGYKCAKPEGAFYLFPESPIPDDVEFVQHALKYNLLVVPGTGFGCPGYFRISYCVSIKTIMDAMPAFEKLINEYKKQS